MENCVKIVGYRDILDKKGKEISSQIFFENPYEFPTHQDMFTNLQTFLDANIPLAERYNLHYTINHIHKGAASKTDVSYVEIIPLDIDHIFTDKIDDYIYIVEKVFRLSRDQFATIATGNGLQCVFLLDEKLEEAKWLSLKASYDLKCDQVDAEIKEKGLWQKVSEVQETGCDKAVFRIGTLRLPSTLNVKKGKPSKKCEVLTRILNPVSIDNLGLYFEKLETKKQLSNKLDKKEYFASTQSKYVFKECNALKEFKEKQGNVNYGQWFASLSVISRFNDVDGNQLCHDLSSGHADYTNEETQKVIDDTVGPSTCVNFSRHFDACKNCKYLKTTLKSPINLREKAFLPHEHTGFHRQTKNGSWMPVYKEIVEKFKQKYDYVSLAHSEILYTYSSEKNMWEILPNRKLLAILRQLMSTKPGDYPNSGVFKQAADHIALEHLEQDADFFAASANKVNFLNGHVEIRGEKLKFFEKSRDSLKHRFLFSLPYEYDESAACPNFDTFITDICGAEEDRALALMEYMGYTISNDTYWAHKFLMLEGDGSNGKSVLLELIRNLCGEGNFSSIKVSDLGNDQHRANLVGKVANICDEVEKKSLINSADLKILTAGGRFSFKEVYSKPSEAVNRAKFIFSTNHGFISTDTSFGLLRRYFPISLEERFVEASEVRSPFDKVADPYIIEKLLDELPGIWNKCISKYLEAKKRKGFTTAKSTKNKIEDFKKSSNPIKMYIDDHFGDLGVAAYSDQVIAKECFKFAPWAHTLPTNSYKDFTRVPVKDIRKDYLEWSKENGHKGEYTVNNFGRVFKTELYRSVRSRNALDNMYKYAKIGSKKIVVFTCIWQPFTSEEM